MDLLDRLLGHDAWTTQLLLQRCKELSDEQLDRPCNIGPRTVRRTFDHITFNVEAWANLMAGQPVQPVHSDRARSSSPASAARFEDPSATLSRVAHAASQPDGWDER